MSDSGDPVAGLKTKYESGSVYLTYIPLNDMTHLLNEEEKFAVLAKKPPHQETLKVFKAFLDGKRERRMNEAVAFVQLNLETGKAGFKRISDQDGSISPIAWSEKQVWGIAEFSDAFLNRLLDLGEKHSVISAGTVSLAEAWGSVNDLKKDPYIPAVRTAELVRDFKSLITKRPDELKDLQSKDRMMYSAIQRFSSDYDGYLTALATQEALAPIRLKAVEMSDTFRTAIRGCEDYLGMLVTNEVQVGLRDAAGSIKGFDFAIAAKTVGIESCLEIYQNLTANVVTPAIVSAQPLRQMIVGSGKLCVDVGGFPHDL